MYKTIHMLERKHSLCIFELVYFARPDSFIFGSAVSEIRKNLGRTLANKFKLDADLVTSVPDSGTFAAIGYSLGSRIPFEPVLFRDHYFSKRTFIEPEQT